MTRSRIKREVEFIEESSNTVDGGRPRKKLVSRLPRTTSPVSIDTTSGETGPTMEEPMSGPSLSPGDMIGTSSHTPPSGAPLGHPHDLAGKTSVEASIHARISAAVKDLITQILPPNLPVDRPLAHDSETSISLMKRFLRAAFSRGTPKYADFVPRANNFLSGLVSLDVDPSSSSTHVQELGKLLIGLETIQKFRSEITLRSDVEATQTLRAQYWKATKELEEIQETCQILQEQQETLDLEALLVQHKLDDLQHQLTNAQAQLELVKTQKTQLGEELEAQKKKGDLRATQLTKIRRDRDHAQAISDRTIQLHDLLYQMEESNSQGVEGMVAQLLQS